MTADEIYHERLQSHNNLMEFKGLVIERLLIKLETDLLRNDAEWVIHPKRQFESFKSSVLADFNMECSMDAPNKPGYYRANND